MGPFWRHLTFLAATGAALITLLAPAISLGDGIGAMDTVDEHIEEDSVTYTPAEAQRMERNADAVTADDARAAAAAVPDDPAISGEWGPVVPWPAVAIHVALLINGKVLAYDSSIPDGSDMNSPTGTSDTFTRATVWDPLTGDQTKANADTGVNIFCTGMAHLMDGRIFLAGGNKSTDFIGIDATNVFDSSDNSWERTEDMAYERWYPSVTPLANGEMLITEGHDPADLNEDHHIPEVREVNGNIRELSEAPLYQDLYPWMDVGPDGLAYLTGPGQNILSLDASGLGDWTLLDTRDDEYRSYGSHALYDIGKILVAGGGGDKSQGRPSSQTAKVIDLNGAAPQVTATDSMEFPRRQYNLTVLADGTALATGGNSSGEDLVDLEAGVYNAELWDPASGSWSTLAAEDETRQYHSTALLLPDGRVLSAGGGVCGTCGDVGYLERNAQVFSPPYLFKDDDSGELAPRPVVDSAPNAVAYDAPMSIRTPNAGSIDKVSLMRLGAVTHSVNMEQRYVPLDFSRSGSRINATSPLNANIAPPGYYMLFVIGSDGVPSNAEMVRIDPSATSQPAAPSITTTVPAPPANDRTPKVKGTAATGSTVTIYSGNDCDGTALGFDQTDQFASAGITVTVPANASTDLRATATDSNGNESPCSSAFTYVEDSSPPDAPTISDTDPDSPANDPTPAVKGMAEQGSRLEIYSTADCIGTPIGSGSATEFTSQGIETTVEPNTSTNLRATATDDVGNVSECSASAFTYVEDSSPPDAPTISDTDPDSPANDDSPEVKGTADAGSAIRIYANSNCTGTPLAGGSASEFSSRGITVAVSEDFTTSLRATATDAAGNLSSCSSPYTYVEDSTGPETAADVTVAGTTATATLSSESGAKFDCDLDSGGFRFCQSPVVYAGLAPGDHNLAVRATDPSGNVDPSPATVAFTIEEAAPPADTTPPRTRINKKPKRKSTKARAKFRFGSTEPRSTFRCRVDGRSDSCGYRLSMIMDPGKHRITVAAIDAAGNVDRRPVRWSWRVKRSKGRSRAGDALLIVATAASGSRAS